MAPDVAVLHHELKQILIFTLDLSALGLNSGWSGTNVSPRDSSTGPAIGWEKILKINLEMKENLITK